VPAPDETEQNGGKDTKGSWLQKLGLGTKTPGPDLVAGVINAVNSIPDALASAVLAGVNPIHGLYAIMVGTPVGTLTTGSVFMCKV
jgi:SulP family sulfate permease